MLQHQLSIIVETHNPNTHMLTRLMTFLGRKKSIAPTEPEPTVLKALASDPPKLFSDILREYIDKYLEENDICAATAQRYDVYWRNCIMFLAVKQWQDLALADVRAHHAEQLRIWLRSNLKTCTIRHASRHVELWKRVTKYAVSMEYTVNDYLSPIKSQRDKPKKIVALEKNEIRKLQLYNFHSSMMRVVADLFLFQCFTGLSYSDIYKYTMVERNGKLWIEGDRQKSGEEYIAYFFPEAREILIKYQWKLPKLSNQKYNEYLKEVAGLVCIKKHLTTHVGRKTNGTLMAEAGAGTLPIAISLGNTVRVCEESYIYKSHNIVENEIIRLGLDKGLMAS